jgi:hypothetical protein
MRPGRRRPRAKPPKCSLHLANKRDGRRGTPPRAARCDSQIQFTALTCEAIPLRKSRSDRDEAGTASGFAMGAAVIKGCQKLHLGKGRAKRDLATNIGALSLQDRTTTRQLADFDSACVFGCRAACFNHAPYLIPSRDRPQGCAIGATPVARIHGELNSHLSNTHRCQKGLGATSSSKPTLRAEGTRPPNGLANNGPRFRCDGCFM